MGTHDPPDGAKERFEALYERWYRPILVHLMSRTTPPADAADVLAEVFLVAWRRLDEIPPGDQAGPWLFGVARKSLANHRRSGFRRTRLGERLAAEIDDLAREGETSDDGVRAALATLGDADRDLLTLTAWDGLKPAEVAVAMRMTPGAVRVRLHRARRRLRLELGRCEDASRSIPFGSFPKEDSR